MWWSTGPLFPYAIWPPWRTRGVVVFTSFCKTQYPNVPNTAWIIPSFSSASPTTSPSENSIVSVVHWEHIDSMHVRIWGISRCAASDSSVQLPISSR